MPLFHSLDDLILDNICDRIKPIVISKDEKVRRTPYSGPELKTPDLKLAANRPISRQSLLLRSNKVQIPSLSISCNTEKY